MNHRNSMKVRGLVEGVGVFPSLQQLASSIEPEGESRDVLLGRFLEQVANQPQPGLPTPCRSDRGVIGFGNDTHFPVSRNVATCVDCLVELFDASDRRHGDPFIACGSCGPRWTMGEPSILGRSSAGRPVCPACRLEFDDPAHRRFQAEAISCPDCGPRLRVEGLELSRLGPIEATAKALLGGKIGALKGTGGYHLACDATSSHAVAMLRSRRRIDARPMTVMVANLDDACELSEISDAEASLLTSSRRPIVRLKRRPGPSILADEVAGASPWLDLMLPDSALDHLLLHEMGGVPLVMVGAQSSGEPIAFEDAAARKWLKTTADFFLMHDQPILIRADDSLTRIAAGGETVLRRSRGHVPEPISLPRECPMPILAVGSQRQATFSLGQGTQALPSHHLSDLRNLEAFRAFEKAIDHFEARLGFEPELVVHDFDPDDAATFQAIRRGVETLAVQHHHAHVASCMVENGLDETVIGVVLDDEALGGDGSLWGGEFLVANYDGFRRAGQFRSVPMPGGSAAVLEPWRMALAHLADAGEDDKIIGDRVTPTERRRVASILKKRVEAPGTSSVARLFDAVAVLAGLRRDVRHEGQLGDELEWQAGDLKPDQAYPFALSTAEDRPRSIIDTRLMIQAIADDVRQGGDTARIARRFHSTLVEMIAGVSEQVRARDGLNVVALTGSVFANKLLLEETIARLNRDGFEVYHHRQVPTHDGGLSLGQLAIAAAWSARQNRAVLDPQAEVLA